MGGLRYDGALIMAGQIRSINVTPVFSENGNHLYNRVVVIVSRESDETE